MVRFHEEAENFKASLWHLAAINATDTVEELLAYQRAIEMLRVSNSGSSSSSNSSRTISLIRTPCLSVHMSIVQDSTHVLPLKSGNLIHHGVHNREIPL